MTEKLKVGIAGYGVVGKRRRQYIDNHPAMTTLAVSDMTFGGDGVLEDGVRFYDGYEKLDAEDLDVLFVSLTNNVAADAVIKGLERGLHVFCEKPPGKSPADIRNVLAAATEHPNLKVKYGFNHRYHDSVRDALAIMRSGELGHIVNLKGTYGKSRIITFGQNDWRTRRELAGGGILLDQGIHMVDLLRLFGGEFTEIHSFISNGFWNFDVEDNAYALMRTDDGVVAMLHSSATQWRHGFQLDIILSKGALTLSGILSGSKSYGAETLTIAWANEADKGNPREQTTSYDHDPSWRDEVNEFAAAILNDKPITNGSPMEALKTMELVQRIYCADPEWRERWDFSSAED